MALANRCHLATSLPWKLDLTTPMVCALGLDSFDGGAVDGGLELRHGGLQDRDADGFFDGGHSRLFTRSTDTLQKS